MKHQFAGKFGGKQRVASGTAPGGDGKDKTMKNRANNNYRHGEDEDMDEDNNKHHPNWSSQESKTIELSNQPITTDSVNTDAVDAFLKSIHLKEEQSKKQMRQQQLQQDKHHHLLQIRVPKEKYTQNIEIDSALELDGESENNSHNLSPSKISNVSSSSNKFNSFASDPIRSTKFLQDSDDDNDYLDDADDADDNYGNSVDTITSSRRKPISVLDNMSPKHKLVQKQKRRSNKSKSSDISTIVDGGTGDNIVGNNHESDENDQDDDDDDDDTIASERTDIDSKNSITSSTSGVSEQIMDDANVDPTSNIGKAVQQMMDELDHEHKVVQARQDIMRKDAYKNNAVMKGMKRFPLLGPESDQPVVSHLATAVNAQKVAASSSSVDAGVSTLKGSIKHSHLSNSIATGGADVDKNGENAYNQSDANANGIANDNNFLLDMISSSSSSLSSSSNKAHVSIAKTPKKLVKPSSPSRILKEFRSQEQ
jgi:hypothetical protein